MTVIGWRGSSMAAAALLLLPVTGRAEEQTRLGEVVVTATRKAMDTADAPAAVSVVTEAEMQSKPVQQVTDALKDLPGVLVRDFAGAAPSAWANQVVIRGIPGYYRTSVMVDGQSINNGFSGGINWSVIDPENIERIEVVRGPFSSLYGGNAMGGAVNIITKAPDERAFAAKAGYGSDDLKTAHVSYGDRIGRFGLRVDAGYKASDGYIKDFVVKKPSAGAGAAVTGLVPTRTDEGDPAWLVGDKGPRSWWQKNAGGTFTLDLTEDSLLTVGVRYHEHQTAFEGYNSYLLDNAGAPVVSGNVDVGNNQRIRLRENNFLFGPNGEDVLRYTAAFEHDFGGGVMLKIDGSYSDNNYWYVSPGATATATGGGGKLVDVPNDRLMGSTQIEFPLFERHFVVAGVAFSRNTLNKREYDLANWRRESATGNLRYRADAESSIYAAFIQDEIALWPSVTAYLGARYDYWQTEGVVQQYINPAFLRTYETRNSSAFSPKASLVWKPQPGTTVRGSVGKAFRAPTLSDMYSTWVATSGKVNGSNPDLDPETTTSFEIGGEQRLWSQTWIAGTLFHNRLSDLIYQRRLANGDTTRENAGQAVIQGAEVELSHYLTPGIKAFANYTFTDTEITENAAEPETVGKRVPYVPEHTASIGIEVAEGPWLGSVIGRYVGHMHGDSENRDVVEGVYGSYDAHWVADAKIGYRFTDWISTSFSITNVLDEEYYQSSLAAGRTFFGEVTARF